MNRLLPLLLAVVWICAITSATVPAGAASGDNRIALVIGNSAYEHVPRLENPQSDAQAVAQSLREVGFGEVTLVEDADHREMRLALQQFSRKVPGADIAVVYFAGHGIEVGGVNYLIPTDARLAEASDVEFETINFDTVLNAMSRARQLRLFILDACRDNPFADSMRRDGTTRSIGRGLARVEPGDNTLVAYAAKSGTQALDGDGTNSPFATALVDALGEPGLEVGYLFRRVRDQVMDETGGRQEPFTYGSLGGTEIFLRPADEVASAGDGADPAPGASGPAGDGSGGVSRLTEAATAWAAIKDTTSPSILRAYMNRFEGTVFADIAAARIAELEAQDQPGPAGAGSAGGSQPGGVDVASLGSQPAAPRSISLSHVSVPVGKWAEGIAFDGKDIWVSESGQRTIARVATDGGAVANRVKVGRLPVDMDSLPDGRIFALIHTDRLIWRQSPGGGPGGRLTSFSECPEALAAGTDAIWVVTLPNCSSESSRAIRVDPDSGRQAQTGVLGEWAQALVVGHGSAWVAHARDGRISAVDAETMAVQEMFVSGASLWAITSNGQGIHAGGRLGDDNSRGVIVTIDPLTRQVVHRHEVSSRIAAMASDERSIVAVGDNGEFWVLSADGSTIETVVSLGTGPFYASDVLIVEDVIVISRQQQNGENGALLGLTDWRL